MAQGKLSYCERPAMRQNHHREAVMKATFSLVPRTRSSHALAASPIANLGFKRGTRIIDLLVSLGFRSSHESVLQGFANFGIGTLAGLSLGVLMATVHASSAAEVKVLTAGAFKQVVVAVVPEF